PCLADRDRGQVVLEDVQDRLPLIVEAGDDREVLPGLDGDRPGQGRRGIGRRADVADVDRIVPRWQGQRIRRGLRLESVQREVAVHVDVRGELRQGVQYGDRRRGRGLLTPRGGRHHPQRDRNEHRHQDPSSHRPPPSRGPWDSPLSDPGTLRSRISERDSETKGDFVDLFGLKWVGPNRQYRLRRRLAEDELGSLWLAESTSTGSPSTIHVLASEFATDPFLVRRIGREL